MIRYGLFLMVALSLALGFVISCSESDDAEDPDVFFNDDDDDDSSPSPDDDDDASTDDDTSDDDDDDNDDDDDVPACWDDLIPGEKVVFATGFSGTEGIAFDNFGDLFVSHGGDMVRIESDGSWMQVATGMSNAVGIAFNENNIAFVCEFGDSSLALVNDGSVYTMDASFVLTQIATGIHNPNFATFTPALTALISDATKDIIYNVGINGVRINWLKDIPSPNGMVYNADRTALYVAGTFAEGGPVYRVDLDTAGKPTGFDTIVELGSLASPDGLAMDVDGNLYVAANTHGKVIMVDPATGDTVDVAAGLTTPASIAFGYGERFDPCSIYVTELLGGNVWRIDLGVVGAPLVNQQ